MKGLHDGTCTNSLTVTPDYCYLRQMMWQTEQEGGVNGKGGGEFG